VDWCKDGNSIQLISLGTGENACDNCDEFSSSWAYKRHDVSLSYGANATSVVHLKRDPEN